LKQTSDSFTVEQTFLESIYVRLLPVPPCTTIDPKPDCPCCLDVGQLAGLSEFFLTKTTSTAFGATNNRQRDCNIDTTHAAEVAVFVEKLIKMSAASYDSVGHIVHYRFGSLVQHLLWTRFTDCTCVYIHTVHLLRQRRRDRVPFVVLFCHELGVDSSVLAIATCSLLDDMYCGVLSIIC